MHIYSEVRVPSIHPIHEELRSGCAINVHGRTKLGKKSQFTVELLSRSSTVMSLDFYAANDEVVATSCTNNEIEKIRSYQYYSSSAGRFHLHISVSDSYFDIEFNGRFVGCFVPAGDVRSVEAIGIKGDVNVNIMTIEGFPLLKSWNTVWLEWTKDTFKQYGYPPVAGSQTSIDGDSSIPVSRSRSDSVSTEECTITMIHWKR